MPYGTPEYLDAATIRLGIPSSPKNIVERDELLDNLHGAVKKFRGGTFASGVKNEASYGEIKASAERFISFMDAELGSEIDNGPSV